MGRWVARAVGVGAGVGRALDRAVGGVVGTGRGAVVGTGRGSTGGISITSCGGCGSSVMTGAKLAAGCADGSGAVDSMLISVARLTSTRSGGVGTGNSRPICIDRAIASATCATTAAPMPTRSSVERSAKAAIVACAYGSSAEPVVTSE
ncbi:MAG: hypothetical protein P1U62_06250, partial [Alteraurantiacibacter sp. bin_em_oilr2.035]|nr:hypothetical protein [Alteraurantiacibacter sp. bin_em_oilr2.035]